jgi:hypothetical protein
MKRIALTTALLTCALVAGSQAQRLPAPYPTDQDGGRIPDLGRDTHRDDRWSDRENDRAGSKRSSKPRSRQSVQALTGQVVEVFAGERRLVVESELSGKLYNVRLADGTKLSADKGTELAGKKVLAITDFKPGQLVRVVYKTPGPHVREVRLRRAGN